MPSPLRVLIVADQPADAEQMVQALRRARFEPIWRRVETETTYLSELQVGADVILAEYAPPQFGAVQALDLLHRHALDIPVVVVAETAGDEGAVECLKRCASDYLRKDRLALLPQAVMRAVELKRLRDAKQQADLALRARTAELAQALHALERQADQLRALTSELTLAEQRERRRLAEVLHDGLQQLLLAARLRMVEVEDGAVPVRREAAEAVIALLEEAMETSRSLTLELSPPILYTGGLLPALQWLARWMGQTHHLAVTLQGGGGERAHLEESTTVLLLQSVRESLFNVVKHAQVATARITLEVQGPALFIQIADDGAGFDPAALRGAGGPSDGFGLFSVRERLELLGGRLEIHSAPGQGTRVGLVVPLHPRQAAPTRGRKLRVLVVNAQLVIRQILVRILMEEPDFDVVGEATDGPGAVALTRQLRPDVVTMDLSLPGTTGIEATRQIRAEFPAIRVIGLALFEESEQAPAMRDAGVAACLTNCGPSAALFAAIRGSGEPSPSGLQ
jgi:signal transduction histidine kinase